MMEKYINKLKEHWKIVLPLVLILAGVGVFFLLQQKTSTRSTIDSSQVEQLQVTSKSSESVVATNKKESPSSTVKENTQTDEIIVDVKGEVKSPNIYHLKSDARVSEAIKLAGGLTDQADIKSVNLAKKLSDEEVVYVANKSENSPLAVIKESSAVSPGQSSSTEKININTADLTELQKLTGVGEKRAQDIIDYRTANGNFKSVDDLGNVSGFGPKTLEKLKDMIAI